MNQIILEPVSTNDLIFMAFLGGLFLTVLIIIIVIHNKEKKKCNVHRKGT